LKLRRHLSPFKNYFHFRFFGRHLEFGNQATSGKLGSVRDVSGMVAHVEAAVGIVSSARCVQLFFSTSSEGSFQGHEGENRS
jgi:hypothetical protein